MGARNDLQHRTAIRFFLFSPTAPWRLFSLDYRTITCISSSVLSLRASFALLLTSPLIARFKHTISAPSDGREGLPPWSSIPRRPQASPFRAPGGQPPSATVNPGPRGRDSSWEARAQCLPFGEGRQGRPPFRASVRTHSCRQRLSGRRGWRHPPAPGPSEDH